MSSASALEQLCAAACTSGQDEGPPAASAAVQASQIQVLELDAFSSVHDLIHSAITTNRGTASLKEVYEVCQRNGRIAYKRAGGSRLITSNDHWKSQIRHALYTSDRFERVPGSSDLWKVTAGYLNVHPQLVKVLVRADEVASGQPDPASPSTLNLHADTRSPGTASRRGADRAGRGGEDTPSAAGSRASPSPRRSVEGGRGRGRAGRGRGRGARSRSATPEEEGPGSMQYMGRSSRRRSRSSALEALMEEKAAEEEEEAVGRGKQGQAVGTAQLAAVQSARSRGRKAARPSLPQGSWEEAGAPAGPRTQQAEGAGPGDGQEQLEGGGGSARQRAQQQQHAQQQQQQQMKSSAAEQAAATGAGDPPALSPLHHSRRLCHQQQEQQAPQYKAQQQVGERGRWGPLSPPSQGQQLQKGWAPAPTKPSSRGALPRRAGPFPWHMNTAAAAPQRRRRASRRTPPPTPPAAGPP